MDEKITDDSSSQATASSFVLAPYIRSLGELQTFVRFSWHGVHHLSGERAFAEQMIRIKRSASLSNEELQSDDDFRALLPPADLEAFANTQLQSGFAYLYTIAVVRLWSIIETAVEDLVLDIIGRVSSAALPEKLRTLRGPLLEFSEASKDDQAAFLIDLLKHELKVALKPGVGKLELLLDSVGYGGPVDATVRRWLLELSQVRNVLVHREGRADRRFIEACPWFGAIRGETIHVARDDFDRYLFSVYWYFGELFRRCVPIYVTEPEVAERCYKKIEVSQDEWLSKLRDVETRVHARAEAPDDK